MKNKIDQMIEAHQLDMLYLYQLSMGKIALLIQVYKVGEPRRLVTMAVNPTDMTLPCQSLYDFYALVATFRHEIKNIDSSSYSVFVSNVYGAEIKHIGNYSSDEITTPDFPYSHLLEILIRDWQIAPFQLTSMFQWKKIRMVERVFGGAIISELDASPYRLPGRWYVLEHYGHPTTFYWHKPEFTFSMVVENDWVHEQHGQEVWIQVDQYTKPIVSTSPDNEDD